MEDISVEEIQNLNNIADVFTIAERYDIPLEDCQTPNHFIERILLHKEKLAGTHRHLLDPHRYEKLNQETQVKSEALARILRGVRSSLENSLPLLTEVVKSRGTSGDLSRDLTDRLQALEDKECNIVIAGQTSAGKSSLLNLLLGMDVLPTALQSCTSSICKLRYNPKFKLRVKLNQTVEDHTFTNLSEMRVHLDKFVFVKDLYARERGDVIREVEIHLPADILKSGITFVDTPGFGEYEAMDNLVKGFIEKGRVSGFIYVIMTDSAGGVQEDRLVRFLRAFLDNTKDEKGNPSFNPKAALFVCNRWDMIHEKDKAKVKTNAIEKLSDVWPKLQESQVCFFSTTKARSTMDIDKEYMTKDLHNLLVSLNGLYGLAEQDFVKKTYSWLKLVMKDCTRYLRTILRQIYLTQREQDQSFSQARDQLVALQTRADDIIDDLKEELEKAEGKLLTHFRRVLQQQETKKHLIRWNSTDIPDMTHQEDWNQQKEYLDAMIINKIFQLFDSTEECALVASNLHQSMLRKVQDKLKLLNNDMQKISDDLDGQSLRSSTSSDEQSSTTEDQETILRDLQNRREKSSLALRLRAYKNRTKWVRGFTPKAFAGRVVSNLLDKVTHTLHQNHNKEHFMRVRTQKVISDVLGDTDILAKFVTRYTDRIVQEINSIRLNIPSFIMSNEILMEEILEFRRQTKKDKNELKEAMVHLEPLKHQLRGFGDVHISDFASNDIMMQLDEQRLGASSQIKISTYLSSSLADLAGKRDAAQGLFSVLQKADLLIDRELSPVMVKVYFCQPKEEELFKEIAKLRCLDHPSVAAFLGMVYIENQSAFVFEDHMTSARRYLRRKTTNVRETLPVLMNSLVEGLEALHKEDLVHMELTLDTVIVDNSGEVKLCNICLPRICNLPSDPDAVETADFACLSPSALRGNVYTKEADMYSLGIIAYELFTPYRPFEEQRSWKLSDFQRKVNPNMLTRPEHKCVSNLLDGCGVYGQSLLMPYGTLKHALKTIFEESAEGKPWTVRRKSSADQTLTTSMRESLTKKRLKNSRVVRKDKWNRVRSNSRSIDSSQSTDKDSLSSPSEDMSTEEGISGFHDTRNDSKVTEHDSNSDSSTEPGRNTSMPESSQENNMMSHPKLVKQDKGSSTEQNISSVEENAVKTVTRVSHSLEYSPGEVRSTNIRRSISLRNDSVQKCETAESMNATSTMVNYMKQRWSLTGDGSYFKKALDNYKLHSTKHGSRKSKDDLYCEPSHEKGRQQLSPKRSNPDIGQLKRLKSPIFEVQDDSTTAIHMLTADEENDTLAFKQRITPIAGQGNAPTTIATTHM